MQFAFRLHTRSILTRLVLIALQVYKIAYTCINVLFYFRHKGILQYTRVANRKGKQVDIAIKAAMK